LWLRLLSMTTMRGSRAKGFATDRFAISITVAERRLASSLSPASEAASSGKKTELSQLLELQPLLLVRCRGQRRLARGGMRGGVDCTWRSVFAALSFLTATFGFKSPPVAAGEVLQISNVWTSPTDREGVDLPLLMTVTNDTDSADALVRVRCPVATFAEKHTVDRGEGAPAMRAVSAIPIAAKSTVELKKDQYHVMLLQVRQILAPGATFNCSIVFQKAGTIETEVHVKQTP
jgi:copper(I)-binding protein